jgi:archaellum component FlaC
MMVDPEIKEYIDLKLDSIIVRIDGLKMGLEGRMAGLENSITALDHKFSGLENRMAGLDHKFSGLENRMAGLDLKMDAVLHSISLFENTYKATQNMCANVLQDLEYIKKEIANGKIGFSKPKMKQKKGH